MSVYLLRRVLATIPVMGVVALFVFALLHLTPGDPAAIIAGDFATAEEWIHKALEKDERSGFAWYLMGMTRERASDFVSSIRAYEAALQLIPEHAEVANDLGRLAFRMGMKVQAEVSAAQHGCRD